MTMWTIYCHVNKANGKRYIGLSKDVSKRWRNGSGYKNNHHKAFAAALEKYGWDGFEHLILEDGIDTLEKANARERYWIAHYHSYVGDPDCRGYNCTIGGDGTAGRQMSQAERERRRQLKLGTKASPETRAKMSAARMGKKQNMTPKKKAQIAKMHAGRKGKPLSDETKLKLSAAHKGKMHSEETKKKISETKRKQELHTKRPKSGKRRSVVCIETDVIYESLAEAQRRTNTPKSSIWACAQGKRKDANGAHWAYVNNEVEAAKDNLPLSYNK